MALAAPRNFPFERIGAMSTTASRPARHCTGQRREPRTIIACWSESCADRTATTDRRVRRRAGHRRHGHRHRHRRFAD